LVCPSEIVISTVETLGLVWAAKETVTPTDCDGASVEVAGARVGGVKAFDDVDVTEDVHVTGRVPTFVRVSDIGGGAVKHGPLREDNGCPQSMRRLDAASAVSEVASAGVALSTSATVGASLALSSPESLEAVSCAPSVP
jgi:hypothetical protein